MPIKKKVTIAELVTLKKEPSIAPVKSFVTPDMTRLFLLLKQGKEYQDRTFPVYSNFIIKLRNAYGANDEALFQEVMREYLQVACRRLPSAPTLAAGELLLMELRILIEEQGFGLVARYLLSVENTSIS